MLAGDQTPFPVPRVAVGVVGGLAELGDTAARCPFEHAIVGDVAPQQEVPVAEIDRSLGPERPGIELLQLTVAVDVIVEAPVARIVLREHAPAPPLVAGLEGPCSTRSLALSSLPANSGSLRFPRLVTPAKRASASASRGLWQGPDAKPDHGPRVKPGVTIERVARLVRPGRTVR